MPMPTPAELWNLIVSTGLADEDQALRLRSEFERESIPSGTAGDAVTELLAKWLVRRRAVTVWQARRLARGDRGPFLIGDYRLQERLEHPTADCRLFRARHEPSARDVCLLLLDPKRCGQLEVWTDIVRRTAVAHEAADPTTSRTWALEQIGPQRFLICEDVPGGSLADEVSSRGRFPTAEACEILLRLARSVAELHRLGTVHGGISLDTIRREPAGSGSGQSPGRIRLLQYPLVGDPHVVPPRPSADSPEAIQRLGMRACFVAPELLLPAAVCDPRSDVYALGCVFHAILSGVPPCWQGNAERSLAQAAFVGASPLGPPAVPAEIATLVSYLVARDPAARYQSAVEAADAIAACLRLPPVSSTLPIQRPPLLSATATTAIVPEVGLKGGQGTRPLVSGQTSSSAAGVSALPELRPSAPQSRRKSNLLPLLGLACCLAAAIVAGLAWIRGRGASPQPAVAVAVEKPTERKEQPRPDSSEKIPEPTPAAPVEVRIVDSADLPWASPTEGRPPTLAYLPPGSQLVMLTRPREMLASEEGRQFLKALGPRAESALEAAAAAAGCSANEIVSLQAGWQVGADAANPDAVVGGYLIRGDGPLPVAGDDAVRVRGWGSTSPREVDGETLHVRDGLAYWLPKAAADRILVIGPEGQVAEMAGIEAEMAARRAGTGEAMDWRERIEANLPPELEDLVGMLDDTRHLTLFGSPSYLFNDGRAVLSGGLAKLVDPMARFLGDGLHAAALSLHFGRQFYLELDCLPPPGASPRKLATRLASEAGSMADAVEEYCNGLNPHPYGRRLVMRLPRMLAAVAGSLRSGVEGNGVVLNCILPEHAAHNLALATELAIEQSPGAPIGPPVAQAAAKTAEAALGRKMSLTFARDTLEKSIQMVSEEIGLPIEILGKDLELDGITKNQSFGLEERNQTADAVLRAILARSNPDGKLVYVIRSRNGVESIEITTRAAAAKRKDPLPAVFADQPATEAMKTDDKKKPATRKDAE